MSILQLHKFKTGKYHKMINCYDCLLNEQRGWKDTVMLVDPVSLIVLNFKTFGKFPFLN